MEDEPRHGNLGYSAPRILTGVVRYSSRHSHSQPLHSDLHQSFTADGTLPYHTPCPAREFPIFTFQFSNKFKDLNLKNEN